MQDKEPADEYSEYTTHPDEIATVMAIAGGTLSAGAFGIALFTWQYGPLSPGDFVPGAVICLFLALIARPLMFRVYDWGDKIERRLLS